MVKYICKRLLMLIPVMLGISLFIFLILSLTPGDPAKLILGLEAAPEDLEALRESLGLNKPVLVQYLTYIWNAFHGDFGTSWFLNRPVLQDFMTYIPNTFYMAVLANLIATVFGIPLGILAAIKHNKTPDYIVTFFALLFTSAPSFWVGMLCQILFSIKLGILPASGASSLRHFILPSFCMGAMAMATNMRSTRTWLLDSIRSDYVRTARAKGAPERRVIVKHALRNSLLPVVTSLGMNFAGAMAGTAVSEAVFAIPGIGPYLTGGVKSKDVPIVCGCVILIALIVGVINLLVDLLYAVIDPRVKYN